jgi:transposase-like protein
MLGVRVNGDNDLFYYLGKRKYNRGRKRTTRWIFGGIERESRKCFLELVPDRTAETLIPIIKKWIEPGTFIMSDGWQSYNSIKNIDQGIYSHAVVVHQENFVQPANTGVHTQNIESLWGRVKRMIKMHGADDNLVASYVAEAMWRESVRNENVFFSMLSLITQRYHF